MMKVLHEPPAGGHWKANGGTASTDIFFISIYEKLEELIDTMKNVANEFEYPVSELGVYLQPIVQAVNYHCEFTLFFDRTDAGQKARVADTGGGRVERLVRSRRFLLASLRPLGGHGLWKGPCDGRRPTEGQEDLRSQQRHEPGETLLLMDTSTHSELPRDRNGGEEWQDWPARSDGARHRGRNPTVPAARECLQAGGPQVRRR